MFTFDQKKTELIKRLVVIGLLVLTALFRVYHFSQSVVFDSDFGRDALFAVRILEDKPTLLGAKASVGGFYLGPLYFYAIASIFTVFGYMPQIVSLFFIGMNVLAAWLIFEFLKKEISLKAGLIGLALFTFNPLLIFSARGATHIPMLPLITIGSVVILLKALKKKQLVWFLLTGIIFGLFFHVHFSSLLFLPGFMLVVFLYGGERVWDRLLATSFVAVGMILMLTPLLLFDLRHEFITGKAFFKYLTSSATGGEIVENMPHWSTGEKMINLVKLLGPDLLLPLVATGIAGVGVFFSLRKKDAKPLAVQVLLILFSSVLAFYLLYSGYLYTYYLIIPLMLLLLFVAAGLGIFKHTSIAYILVASICLISIPRLKSMYLAQYRTIPNLSIVTHRIENHLNSSSYDDFAIFKDSKDGMTGLAYEYRFLLRRDGYIPVYEESYDQASILYVIREDGDADPLSLGNWEVAQFSPKSAELIDELHVENRKISLFALFKD